MYEIQEPDELRMLVVRAVADQQISPLHLTQDEVIYLQNFAMELLIDAHAEEGDMAFYGEEWTTIH